MVRYWEPFTTCLLGRALLPFLLNVTTYIEFLSRSLSYISDFSYSTWFTVFSTHPYFARAPDRFYHDASLSGFTDIDLWAQSIADPTTLYYPQDIPATCSDAYYHAAEVRRSDGAIRSRMPFKRPLFGGLEAGAHVSPDQAAIRQRFKSAIDRFITLPNTDRATIYARSLGPARWYFNFFLSEEFELIKRVTQDHCHITSIGAASLFWEETWNTTRSMVLYSQLAYFNSTMCTYFTPVNHHWVDAGNTLEFRTITNYTDFEARVDFTIIEFY